MDLKKINGRHAMDFVNQFDYIREAGTAADRKAADTIIESVKALGASPITEKFTVPATYIDKAVFKITSPFEKTYTVGGYFHSGNTPEDGIDAPFLYAENGDAISLKNAAGKIVMVNDPMRPDMYAKLVEAGAAAFLTITGSPIDENVDRIPADRRGFFKDPVIQGGVIHMLDAAEIVERISENGGSGNDAPAMAHFELAQHSGETTSQNIRCRVEGTDPSLKKEVLTVTAHYDSVPAGKGAYDNMAACGITYELLTYFLQHPAKRTLEFIFLGAEEKGLVGSRAYCEKHEAELADHRFNMNIDLAGQLVGGNVFGVTAEHCVDDLLLQIAEETGIGAIVKNQIWASDSNSFAAKGVPAITLNRDGFGMHTRHDTLEKLSWWSVERSSRLLGAITDRLTNAEVFPFERKVPEEYLEKLNSH